MDVIESRFFIDNGEIYLAEVFYDECAENPCRFNEAFGNVYSGSFERLGNIGGKEMFSVLGKFRTEDGTIDIGKCHGNGIAVIPFCYVENNHGPGTSSVRECDASSANGFIFADRDKWEKEWGCKSIEDAENSFRNELTNLEDWCNGCVYGIRVSKVVPDGTPYNRGDMCFSKNDILVYSDWECLSGIYEDHKSFGGMCERFLPIQRNYGVDFKLYDSIAEAESALVKGDSGKVTQGW